MDILWGTLSSAKKHLIGINTEEEVMENNITLEKKLSPLNVWSLALGCIIGCGAFLMPGNTFLPNAGPLGTAIAMGIAGVIMTVIAFNYNYMVQRYPVAGGEFTYTQHAFGRTNGFICAWFLGLSYLTIVPFNGTALGMVARSLLSNVFQFGFHYVIAGYDIYLGELLLAMGTLVLFAWVSIRGVKTSGVFQTILVISLIGGVAVVALAAIISDKASWANMRPAFHPVNSRLSGILAVLVIAPFSFVGFDTIPQAAEEFNFSQKKARRIMVVAIVFGALIYTVLNTVTASILPAAYESWSDYVDSVNTLYGLESLPTFYAAYELLGKAGLVLLGVAVMGAILSGICGFYMATSRLLYSMAKENMLPAVFRKLHPKYKTPYITLLFIMGVSLVAPLFGRTALGWIVDMSSLGAAIGYGYTSAAVFRFARKERNTVMTVMGLLGTLVSVMFAVILLIPIPGLHCSLGKESLICLIVWSLLGVLFYAVSQKRK